MHRADEAREGDLLEFVVDKVADGVSEGEAGGSGGEGGPVDRDGHLHGFGDVGRGREGERVDWKMEIGSGLSPVNQFNQTASHIDDISCPLLLLLFLLFLLFVRNSYSTITTVLPNFAIFFLLRNPLSA